MKRYLAAFLSIAMCALLAAPAGAADDSPFARFIRPISNPVYNIDPRNETTVRLIHAHQKLPEHIKTTLGRVRLDGDLNVTAVQLTFAVNERFSIVAEKTGYIDFDPDYTLENENGWADYGAGLKYAFIYDPENEFILSGRLFVELTQGSKSVFQGNGEGTIAPSISFLKALDKLQLVGTVGAILPIDGDAESTLVYDAWHVSYALTPKFFPLLELNHFAVIDEGDRRELVPGIAEFEGGDLINMGSHHARRNKHIVTMAAGFRYRLLENRGILKNMDIGVAYEFPLTDKNANLMRDRWTFDLAFYF